jgi:Arc/MetJ-type ribon-helix-helix transcriptional regulator
MRKETEIMSLEIHKPEPVQRVNAHIQTGQFHDTDELIEKALDALEEKTPAPASAAARRRAAGRKSLVEVFAPLRGLSLDFGRNKSASRPLDLG